MNDRAAIAAIDKPVIVLGAGGHAKALVGALARLKVRVLGLVDADPAKKNSRILDVPVLGDDSAVMAHAPESVLLVNGLGTVKSTAARQGLYDRFVARGYRFATLVDPLALIAGPIELGAGAQILAGAILQSGVSLGADSIIGIGASIDHDCVIGAHVHIAPGATLSGGVHVGDGAHIGTGASVIHAIRIGAGSIIGAGATVIRDVPDGVTAVGTPARVLSPKPGR